MKTRVSILTAVGEYFKRKSLNLIMILILFTFCSKNICAQGSSLKNNYVGFIPAILAEPYDTINAIEVNLFPFLYELRVGNKNDIGLQVRPIFNYRFLKNQSGFSQIGGTFMVNKYFLDMFGDDFWLIPKLGVYYTYAYNRLDSIQTMTLGIEPGAFMQISDHFSSYKTE